MYFKFSICNISFIFLFMTFMILFLTGVYFISLDYTIFIEWDIISINSVSVVITLLLDYIRLIFISFVLFISSLVIYYSKDYIRGDYNINRFILLVLIFVFSIICLIIRPNLIRILLGWDGLGLVSYCLVIYYQNVKSYNAGIITALSNRVGDVALLLAIAWMINFGSFNYIYYLKSINTRLEVILIRGLVVLAAITKRAQIPFSAWLPAAIAAPTPVSALVHSSTLVTAGVYLLIRFRPILENTWVRKILLLISGLTIFMAGIGANYEYDLKKIIALSTLRQLGLIMRILSLGYSKLAYFHILAHALFKALLFICAGAIIHNMRDSQDIRRMGSLINQIPITCSSLNIANLALCGFPFLAGFYSKDLILEVASIRTLNLFSYILFFFSTGLTICYSFRLVYYCLTGDTRLSSCHPINDNRKVILTSISGLLFMTVIGGATIRWVLFPTPSIICLPFLIKIIALFVRFTGGWVGYELSKFAIRENNKGLEKYKMVLFLGSIWFMPAISTLGVIKIPLIAGNRVIKSIDQGWNEYLGAQGLYKTFSNISSFIQILQTNIIKVYIIIFSLWIILLFVLNLYLNSLNRA